MINWKTLQEKLLSMRPSGRFGGVLVFGVLLPLCLFFIVPPAAIETPRFVGVKEGTSVRDAALLLQQKEIIRSPETFIFLVKLFGRDRGIIAGEYRFSEPQSVVSVAFRLISGAYDIEPVKVTLPEGASVREMASILKDALVDFDEKGFITEGLPYEGYLFPDTYYFLPGAEPTAVIQKMRTTFDSRIEPLRSKLATSKYSLHEVVVMASLLEEEARTLETKRMIAGILWNRIEIGMRLQVDAVFPYIIGRNTFELTQEDLATTSPYNTYRNTGLPPGAITNPGYESLEAALTPVQSSYVYYLSDMQGEMHYAKDFDTHVENKRKYLR